MFTSSYSYMSSYSGKLKNTDENYKTDWNQMNVHNISNIGAAYWLASRYVNSTSANSNFSIQYQSIGSSSNIELFTVYSDGSRRGYGPSEGLRPVFTLKSNIKITGGSGTSTDPYTLGV